MRILGFILLLAALVQNAAAECVATTDEIEQMAARMVRLTGPGDQHVEFEVHVADTGRERAAGFQHVCPEIAETVSILFLFATAAIPRFHMNNVYMPLDIAFIGHDGVIHSIQTMQPYVIGAVEKKLWSPPVPVVAALETRAGLFEELGISANEWSLSLLR